MQRLNSNAGLPAFLRTSLFEEACNNLGEIDFSLCFRGDVVEWNLWSLRVIRGARLLRDAASVVDSLAYADDDDENDEHHHDDAEGDGEREDELGEFARRGACVGGSVVEYMHVILRPLRILSDELV